MLKRMLKNEKFETENRESDGAHIMTLQLSILSYKMKSEKKRKIFSFTMKETANRTWVSYAHKSLLHKNQMESPLDATNSTTTTTTVFHLIFY